MNIDTWLLKELVRINKLEDSEEHQRQLMLMSGIVEKKNEFDDYIWNYKKALQEKDMKSRGIIFEKCEVTSKSLKSKWEDNFCIGLTKEDKKRIYFNHYLWHVFSYEVKDSLVKNKARQAFNRKRKNHVYVFFDNREDVFYIENAVLLRASDFDMEDDVYIVDSKMNWSYIHTHELQCGPYFTKTT